MMATIFYYINSNDVANIYVDNIGIYVQMKRAKMPPFPLNLLEIN